MKNNLGSVRFKPFARSPPDRAKKVKEPGKNPMPGLKMTFPKLSWKYVYLVGAFVDGGVGAFVAPPAVLSEL
jgi:hypothetical protein